MRDCRVHEDEEIESGRSPGKLCGLCQRHSTQVYHFPSCLTSHLVAAYSVTRGKPFPHAMTQEVRGL